MRSQMIFDIMFEFFSCDRPFIIDPRLVEETIQPNGTDHRVTRVFSIPRPPRYPSSRRSDNSAFESSRCECFIDIDTIAQWNTLHTGHEMKPLLGMLSGKSGFIIGRL
jgi:hypothetical protein